jgi:hypothetical protein
MASMATRVLIISGIIFLWLQASLRDPYTSRNAGRFDAKAWVHGNAGIPPGSAWKVSNESVSWRPWSWNDVFWVTAYYSFIVKNETLVRVTRAPAPFLSNLLLIK